MNTVSVYPSGSLVWMRVDCLWSASNRPQMEQESHIRLHGIGHGVQPVLNLACLLANGIERAGVVGGIGTGGPAERVLVAEIVARGATDLGHGEIRR